jgi:outer membrane protein OmpA-like peptidoglycan-associated protein
MTIRFAKSVSRATLLSGLILTISSPVLGLEIRQDLYNYSPVINTPVQIPIHQTFVIERQPSFYARPKTRPFPVVHFDLGSASLSQEASNKLLIDLRECCAACPLYLIGYTCSLGGESQNQKLSSRRAEAVSALLQKNGYKVVSVEGKGMIFGDNPENRKVEIRLSR